MNGISPFMIFPLCRHTVAIDERLTAETQGFSCVKRAVTGGLAVGVLAFALQPSSARQRGLGERMFHPSEQQ